MFSFFDVVCGEDHGDAGFAQTADELPHALAQFHIDARRRLVEKQDARLMRQRLGNHHTPLHAARKRHDLFLALIPEREVLEDLLNERRVAWLSEQPSRKTHRRLHALERFYMQFLRHKADQAARGAEVGDDVVPAHRHRARARVHQPAHDRNQRCLAGAVRPKQRQYFAFLDVEADCIERLQSAGVSLGEFGNGDDRLHERRLDDWKTRCGRDRYIYAATCIPAQTAWSS